MFDRIFLIAIFSFIENIAIAQGSLSNGEVCVLLKECRFSNLVTLDKATYDKTKGQIPTCDQLKDPSKPHGLNLGKINDRQKKIRSYFSCGEDVASKIQLIQKSKAIIKKLVDKKSLVLKNIEINKNIIQKENALKKTSFIDVLGKRKLNSEIKSLQNEMNKNLGVIKNIPFFANKDISVDSLNQKIEMQNGIQTTYMKEVMKILGLRSEQVALIPAYSGNSSSF